MDKFIVLDDMDEMLGGGENLKEAIDRAEECMAQETAADAPFPVYVYQLHCEYRAVNQGIRLIPSGDKPLTRSK